ncbi:prenyltransferase/squalene oxidase repeat-containing protein [Streptomyces sp. NPDC006285]|uniref:prenyltransferase/squalene oxidase repeat-containing protein n=1 Tax=Streptomyces sp. NPDC006285 TaxID=3364742 RepID=UPI0036C7A547
MNGAQRLPFGESAEQALERATEFLRTARDADGWWNDYEVRGPGQFWATAFVGASLAELPEGPGRSAAVSAWELLRQTRGPSDGWGYCPQVPGDADITSWVLRLAEALEAEDDPRADEGYRFVAAHLQEDGGISSYLPRIAAPFLERVAPRWDAWYASHPCVTTAAAGLRGLPVRERLLTRLRELQRPEGSWPAYWWPDREYPTALAAEALTAGPSDEVPPEVSRAAGWAAARIGEDGAVRTEWEPEGSAFATAFALRTVLAGRSPQGRAAAARAASHLIDAQEKDGSWRPSAWCRVPGPMEFDPDARERWERGLRGKAALGSVVLDTKALYTTASVVAALARTRTPETSSAAAPGGPGRTARSAPRPDHEGDRW